MRTRTLVIAIAMIVLVAAVGGCRAGAPSAPAPTAAGGATPIPAGAKQAGAYVVWLAGAPNPAVRGDNTLDAKVSDANGQPISDAKVTFDIDMTTMSHGKNVVAATNSGDGHYWGKVFYMMAGPWRVIITVERPGQAAASARFDLSVNQR